MDELDDLDAEHREFRRQRLERWTRLQKIELARAKSVLEDPSATREQRREARILIGAYSIGPELMLAGATSGRPPTLPLEVHNRHSRVPSPPKPRWSMLWKLRTALHRSVTPASSFPVLYTDSRPHPESGASASRLNRISSIASAEPLARDDHHAPDLAEEILGWKVLAFGDDGLLWGDFDRSRQPGIPRGLASPTVDAYWPDSGWLLATCTVHTEHEPPVEDCSCGIYALDKVRAVRPYIWKAPLTVLARVGLAGKVIPGSTGWRAERARVVALTRTGAGPRDYPHMLARVANHYGVPILDLDLLDPRPEAPSRQE